jgi:hypothetical protein
MPPRVRNPPNDLPSRLVLPLALIGDLSQQVVLGPGQVGHLDDDLRPNPMNLGKLERRSEAAVARRLLGERHALYMQRLQDARQAFQFLLRHAGAGAPGIVQAPVVGVIAQ